MLDLRDGGPLRHARERAVQARALRDECVAFLPRPAQRLVPLLDRMACRWLMRSCSPYVSEIAAIATALGFSGAWFLNGSYQWGCTTLARDEDGRPWLARTLDWPFPGLGRHAEVARLRGVAGDFFSVTWPGYVGVLTAMAPGRFAAAVNQAPMWRRTLHPWLRPYDLTANAVRTWRVRHIPPDQLLRLVFETAAGFAEARQMLEATPVARPVIFTLAGCAPGETCVIERTEEAFATRTENTCAANDWMESRAGWEGRISAERLLNCSFAEAAENSCSRRTALSAWADRLDDAQFPWVVAPVLNPYTRLAVAMCPASGALNVCAYEMDGADALPAPVAGVSVTVDALQAA